jgi:amidohydrolase
MIDNNLTCQETKELQRQLVQWRRALHQIPECGIELPKTMAFIREQLEAMGISYRFYENISCIVATIGCGGKCFLLRSDVDALPVTEEADVPFKSTNGRMHACGHDMHGTILLGAAKLLKDKEKELNGTVKLLFQSGEETLNGAKAAIDMGVLEEPVVNAGLAMHVNPTIPLGVASTGKEFMSAIDGFRITLIGKGGHGSMPEACIDPINAAVQVYLAFQSLIAREISGVEEAVLTIGQLVAGEAPNVIPVRAQLQGTLRTFSSQVRGRLVTRMREIVSGVAQTYRCQYEYETLYECAALITDDFVTASVEKSMMQIDPQLCVLNDGHNMGSEDFAEISQRVPSAYFMLGAGLEQEEKRCGFHDPKVEFNENVLSFGAAVYAKAAADWLRENG